MSAFRNQMASTQIRWRREFLFNQKPGRHSRKTFDHLLPVQAWELNLWYWINSGAPNSLPRYLEAKGIRKPNNSHHLLSSWVFCASLYFPFRESCGKELLAGFLREKISCKIEAVTQVEMRYQAKDQSLAPRILLGENGARRGAGITAPDLAIVVETMYGSGLILVNCTFTETGFRPCFGRVKHAYFRPTNPDPERCLEVGSLLESPARRCHLQACNRRYWELLLPSINPDVAGTLSSCPAAYNGFQLFRQQALAEGIANSGLHSMVVSALAYDQRNSSILGCLSHSTSLPDIRRDWGKLFSHGGAYFTTFTHQDWVTWVAEHDNNGYWEDWIEYVGDRYGL